LTEISIRDIIRDIIDKTNGDKINKVLFTAIKSKKFEKVHELEREDPCFI